ncbi:mRNA 3'-end-processing protein rna-14 [Neurospora hispaniola]|uniref:mRNA 3'-end-processing protein RNA14 n=1 Tax=Neurospora hispaniola TaxID=588809 RepID=A0AAJ0HYU9_9PEZI|nr:mRNA 3'-end-processing protein rna-14 [Neurospora hispaniola]
MSDDYDPTNINAASWEEQEDYGEADGSEQYGEAEGSEQQDIQHSSEHQEAEYSVESNPNDLGDHPSQDGNTDDVGDDYDPASVVTSSVPAPSAPAPQEDSKTAPQPAAPVAKKPRTAGGFLVGDSDDEDEDGDDDGEPQQQQQQQQQPHQVAHKETGSGASSSGGSAPAPAPASATAAPQSHSPALQTATLTVQDNAGATTFNAPPVPQQVSHQSGATTAAVPTTPSSAAPAVDPTPVTQPAPDRVAIYEDQIRDDPRGAMNAWLELMKEKRARNDIDGARQVYERFLAIFPQAADIWVEYLDLELSLNNFPQAEGIFAKCLMTTPNVNLWTRYLDYIRRRNDLNDSTGQARQTVSQAYEFVIDNIGLDKDSGKIWAEYIQFIKFGPGTVGGSQWQDQQKMDQLRKAYQRAICVPISNVNTLWKEYDQFEMGLNKLTGRKYLSEKSPSYMSAKSANTALEHITRGLNRTNLPRLPPAPGFDGDQEFMEQVEIWKKWIAWEKSDPLDLKDDKDQPGLYQKRILYVYNQALMALRFWPEMWVDAAQWCFDNNITTVENKVTKDGNANGVEFLIRGIEANPESVLLAFKHADHIESTYPIEENDEAKIQRGEAVKAPYNKVLDTLYAMIKSLKEKEAAQIAKLQEMTAAQESKAGSDNEDGDGAADNIKKAPIEAIQKGYAAQTQLLSRMISFVWIALIRAMRRVQGKGGLNVPLGGMRKAFHDARARGRLTSDVYAAVAQLEWTIYKDPAGGKIFDRGAKLFPEDENFTLENIKYLHSRDDHTNARVLFETVVNRLTQKPELVHKAKPLYQYFHKYESQFGELAQVTKLEKRMAELFPEDPKLAAFTARYASDKFDPITARIIVSPTTQLRPKNMIMPSIEQQQPQLPMSRRDTPAAGFSPRPQGLKSPSAGPGAPFAPYAAKRPLDDRDYDDHPRKIARSEHDPFVRGASPLKGAAGRRLDQQRRMGGTAGAYSGSGAGSQVAPIARDITFLLSQIPRVEFYDSHRLNPSRMVSLLQNVKVPEYLDWKRERERMQQMQGDGYGGYGGGGGGGGGGGYQGGGHARNISQDYAYRESPGPLGGRPLSPFTGGPGSRLASATAAYRQAPVGRPESSGSYEPPPAAQYGVPPPAQYDGGWAQQQQQQQYGQPPAPQGYRYGNPPPPY